MDKLTMNPNPPIDEIQWVIQITSALDDEELEEDNGIPMTIFNVPKALLSSKSECYTPQLIGLGPYHRWRPELYEMERYKLSAAKRIQKQLHGLRFQNLVVDHLAKLQHRIRAHYHRYLDCNGETLACMMAVDASFLVEFLQIYSVGNDMVLQRVSSRLSHLLDHTGRKPAHHMILRDIVMLENQIPLFCLGEILNAQYSRGADDVFRKILVGFTRKLYPFTITDDFPGLCDVERHSHSHLLELLYNTIIIPGSEETRETNSLPLEDQHDIEATSLHRNYCDMELVSASILNFGSRLIQASKRVLVSRPVKLLMKISWIIITRLPGLSILKQPIEHLFSSIVIENRNSKQEDGSRCGNMNRPPLMEEVTIPSVTELIVDAGVRFSPTTGGLATIEFNTETGTFYLPAIRLDVDTEVVLRNLVAFEVSLGKEQLVLARYTELMNGIIDSEEDAKSLRERGVVLNHMKSDGEVRDLWNGMSKSVRLTRVASLDRVIEDVNTYYNSRWRVRVGRFTTHWRKNVPPAVWQFLRLMAGVLLLVLMSLHALCLFFLPPMKGH